MAAQLGISTTAARRLLDVPALVDFSGQHGAGWEQETLDLTAFVGKTIQVVW